MDVEDALATCLEVGCVCAALSAGAPACTSCLLAQGDGADKAYAGYITVLLTSTCGGFAQLTSPTILSTEPSATGPITFQPGGTTSLNFVTSTTPFTGLVGTVATQLTASTSSQKSSAFPHSYSSMQTLVSFVALFVGSILLLVAA